MQNGASPVAFLNVTRSFGKLKNNIITIKSVIGIKYHIYRIFFREFATLCLTCDKRFKKKKNTLHRDSISLES